MKLKNIGEFGLIEKIMRATKTDRSVIKGIGDDAAVLKWTKDKHLIVTADMLIEDVHFLRKNPPEKIGWKAICCGVSDIAVMGGLPKWAVVSYGLPQELDVKYVSKIYAGMKKAAKKFGVNIVGGDTNSSKKIVLDVTVMGGVKNKNLTLRSGAKIGDFIFVTGALGGSIAGKHLNFTPRLKESQALVKNFKINSMIDISDGLSSDLDHILEQSNAGAMIYDYLIPRSKGATLDNALSDGEDFELLFTMSKKEGFKLLAAKNRLFNIPITRIGTITEKKDGAKLVDIFGRKQNLRAEGFRHF